MCIVCNLFFLFVMTSGYFLRLYRLVVRESFRVFCWAYFIVCSCFVCGFRSYVFSWKETVFGFREF